VGRERGRSIPFTTDFALEPNVGFRGTAEAGDRKTTLAGPPVEGVRVARCEGGTVLERMVVNSAFGARSPSHLAASQMFSAETAA
jgi:hypothetical protein